MKVQSQEIDGETWFKFDKKFDKVRYFYGNILTIGLIIFLLIIGSVLFYVVMSRVDLLTSHPCGLCEDLGYICSSLEGAFDTFIPAT